MRNRLREQQASFGGEHDEGRRPPRASSSSQQSDTQDPVISFYDRNKWSDGDVGTDGEALANKSCRGDHSSATTASTHAPSSNSSCSEVGFWRHGVWQARARTPQEARQHRGGNGAQRSLRKQQRVSNYLQGTWKPAWLERYSHHRQSLPVSDASPADPTPCPGTERQDRPDDQLNWTNSVQTDSLAGSEALPSHLTDPDPWSGHWGNYDTWSSNTWSNTWWEDSSWAPSSSSWWPSTNGCWVTSTTSSTSAPIEAGDFPPNFGLFPEVRPARPEEPPIPWRLQLTGAERRLLQEGNVPELPIERIDAILESLEDHEAAESGPESRWALARLIGQAEGALDSLQTIVDILQRRLHPRGYLPITRTPRTVAERVRLYNWMRDSAGFFADTLEFHLRALRPAEERPHPNEVDEDSLHSAPGAPSHASSSSSGEGDNGDHVSEADDHIPDTGTVPRMAPRTRTPGTDRDPPGRARLNTSHRLEYSALFKVPCCLLGRVHQ